MSHSKIRFLVVTIVVFIVLVGLAFASFVSGMHASVRRLSAVLLAPIECTASAMAEHGMWPFTDAPSPVSRLCLWLLFAATSVVYALLINSMFELVRKLKKKDIAEHPAGG